MTRWTHGTQNAELLININNYDPFALYKLFISDNMLKIIVEKTNMPYTTVLV